LIFTGSPRKEPLTYLNFFSQQRETIRGLIPANKKTKKT
jgi:hypothetical protein